MMKNTRRLINKEIFSDTQYQYENHPILREAVRMSIRRQKFIPDATIYPEQTTISSGIHANKSCKVIVSEKRSLEAAEPYAKKGKKVCVLNFASAINPGGAVLRGYSTQEEAICRCSTLYPCLNVTAMWEQFYNLHRSAKNPLYNHDCIYTPDVS